MLDTLLGGVSALGTIDFWIAVVLATTLAGLVGLIPGVGSITVLAISVPFVVFQVEDPVVGLVFLATIGGVSNTLDSIPAVLARLSVLGNASYLLGGAPARAARTGRAYARRGVRGLDDWRHRWGNRFGGNDPGYQAGCSAVWLCRDHGYGLVRNCYGVRAESGSNAKGLIAACFGILLSTVGVHGSTSVTRFTFGQPILWEGLPVIVVSLGAFALPEILDLATTGKPSCGENHRKPCQYPRGIRWVSRRSEPLEGCHPPIAVWRVHGGNPGYWEFRGRLAGLRIWNRAH